MPDLAAADLWDDDDTDPNVTGQLRALVEPGAEMRLAVLRQFDECNGHLEKIRGSLAPRPRRLLMLLVDDEPSTLTAMAVGLSRAGIDVEGVSNAGAAMARCRESTYDAAVIDVWLPGASGVQLARELLVEWPSMPIILISGDPSVAVEALAQSGANAFLPKPFGPVELLGALAAFLPELKGP